MPMIGFNQPYLAGKEFDYLRQAMDNRHVSGDGPFTKKCSELLEQELGVQRERVGESDHGGVR